MKTWQKALISTTLTLVIGAIYLFSVYQHRKNPGVATQPSENAGLSQDDLAVVRMKFPQHYNDVLSLAGTSVWMKNGYTMPYYPFTGAVDFHRTGLIPPDQRLDIKKIVKAVPGDTKLYATPIGVIDGSDEAYFSDVLFYYDDPHTIYDSWPKEVWAAIDAHQAKTGMNELQVRTALGQKTTTDGGSQGNRTVTYNANGKKWVVKFEAGRATSVKSE